MWRMTFIAILIGMTTQGAQRTLDLTPKAEPKRLGDQSEYVESCARGSASGRLESAPLTLAVEGLNSREYTKGGAIVADLRLTNVGQQPILIPWVRRTEFAGDFHGPRAVQATLGLYMTNAKGQGEHMLVGAVLRGSPDLPGTTQTIAPGETIRVRLPGIIPVSGSATGLESLGGPDVQIAALAIFSNAQCETWQPIRSTPVKVRIQDAR